MMVQSILQVVAAIVGLAIIAVIVSRRSDTANVANSFFKGTSGLISSAVSPVVGGGGAQGYVV